MITAYAVKKKGKYVNQTMDTTYTNSELSGCFVFNKLEKAMEVAEAVNGRVMLLTVYEADYLLVTGQALGLTPDQIRDVFGDEFTEGD